MDNKNKNAQAFPLTGMYAGESLRDGHGLTKREYFAAKAMQGLLSKLAAQGDQLADSLQRQPELVAQWSVKMADSLLKELDNNN